MSKRNQVLRGGVLATAVLAALSAFASGLASKPGQLRVQGVSQVASPQASFDRFIVRYKDGASRTQASALNAFTANAQRAGVAGVKMGPNGVASALTARYVRKMGMGADVIQLSRKLDAVEADVLLAQLRADPAVAHAEPDLLMQPVDFVPACRCRRRTARAWSWR